MINKNKDVIDFDPALLDTFEVPNTKDDLEDRLMQRLLDEGLIKDDIKNEKQKYRRPLLFGSVAASILILVMFLHQNQSVSLLEARSFRTEERITIHLGDRAVIVAEADTFLSYELYQDQSVIMKQNSGSILYLVSSGNSFVVETPSAAVTVVGTRFRLDIDKMRNIKQRVTIPDSASILASAALLITTYEGTIKAENAHGRILVAANRQGIAESREKKPILLENREALVEQRKLDSAVGVIEDGVTTETEKRFKLTNRRKKLNPEIIRRHNDLLFNILEKLDSNLPAKNESISEVKPGIPMQYIRDAIKELKPLFDECYDMASEQTQGLEGSIVVVFEIVGDAELGGLVAKSDIEESNFNFPNDLMEECVRETIYGIILPPPQNGGKVIVRYPFHFRTSPDTRESTNQNDAH